MTTTDTTTAEAFVTIDAATLVALYRATNRLYCYLRAAWCEEDAEEIAALEDLLVSAYDYIPHNA